MKKITALLLVLLLLFAAGACSKAGNNNKVEDVSTTAENGSVPEILNGEWADKSGSYTLTIDGDSLKICSGSNIISRFRIKTVSYPELSEQSVFIVERETGGFLDPFTELRIMDDGTLSTVMAAPGGQSVDYVFEKIQ